MGPSRKFGESARCLNRNVMSNLGLYRRFRVTALEQLQGLPCAPSVGMHDVPPESVGEHLGLRKEEDELDKKLARECA